MLMQTQIDVKHLSFEDFQYNIISPVKKNILLCITNSSNDGIDQSIDGRSRFAGGRI